MEDLEYGNLVDETLVNRLLGVGLVMVVLSLVNSFMFHYPFVSGLLTIISFVILAVAIYLRMCASKLDFGGDGVLRLMHRDLIKHLPFKGKGTVLNVGCGNGALGIATARVHNHAKVIAVDTWEKASHTSKQQCERNAKIEKVKKRIDFQVNDPAHLSYEDETFDAIISHYAYHGVKGVGDKTQLIEESLRVLKKGGAFAFEDTFGNTKDFGDIEAFIEKLKAEGITQITYVSHLEDSREYITKILKAPWLLKNLGMIYGIK